MKTKTILILCSITLFMMIGHLSLAQNSKKNRIQVETELGGFKGIYGHNYILNTKVGYLFNDKLFIGAGTGIGTEKYRLIGPVVYFTKIPLFLSVKYNFQISKRTSIIVAADGGYNILAHNSEKSRKYYHSFLIPKAGIGFKLGKEKKRALNIYAGYDAGTVKDETGIVGLFVGFNF